MTKTNDENDARKRRAETLLFQHQRRSRLLAFNVAFLWRSSTCVLAVARLQTTNCSDRENPPRNGIDWARICLSFCWRKTSQHRCRPHFEVPEKIVKYLFATKQDETILTTTF